MLTVSPGAVSIGLISRDTTSNFAGAGVGVGAGVGAGAGAGLGVGVGVVAGAPQLVRTDKIQIIRIVNEASIFICRMIVVSI
jgi:hypothetical protein